MNLFIRAPEVRVISDTEGQIGVMTREQAFALAQERKLDLVEVNPSANPPVVKLVQYGQFKYQQEKMERKAKAAQKEVEIKGIRLSSRIGRHDLEIRKEQTLKFFDKGHSVKVEIIMRGRERQHIDVARQVMVAFIDLLKAERDIRIDQPIARQADKLFVILALAGGTKELGAARDAADAQKYPHESESKNSQNNAVI